MHPFWIPIYTLPLMCLSLYHGIAMSASIPSDGARVALQIFLILTAGALAFGSIIYAHKR